MKTIYVLAMGLGLGLAACASAQPDPDHGVSNASYRSALAKSRDDVAAASSRLKIARDQDLATPKPAHSKLWWDAQCDPLDEAARLDQATLDGTNKVAGQ